MFRFLSALLKAVMEYMRYTRAVRFMRRVHINADLIIYCIKKAARESSIGQRVTITLETATGPLTIKVDTEGKSPSLTKEDELFEQWRNARNNVQGDKGDNQ